jgi:Polyketide cyclase / dehydrase and lipid transport
MSTHRFSVHANLVPANALFLWIDLDRVSEWMHGVTRVSDVTGPPDRPDFALPGQRNPLVVLPGSKYVLWFRFGPVRHVVLLLDQPQPATGHRTRLDGRFRRGEMLVTFEPEGGGSRVRLEVRTEGLLPSIAARLLALGFYRGSFRAQLRAFARVAERERLGKLII